MGELHEIGGTSAAAAPIEHPGAWKVADFSSPLDYTIELTPTHLGDIQDAIREIKAGDVIWISPGEKHWHGGAPNTGMVHIATQEALDGKTATWMEHVTDAEYNAKVG